ncbi:MAG: M50 family metallopeptidase [Lentimicrobiaceae bacterium]|nr:M50 family metallopeptidase [Lentimicrobiaceae bacterium]
MKTILKYLILPICLVLATIQLFPVLMFGKEHYELYKWFGAGFGAYFILHFLLFRKNGEFAQTFSHELTHTLVGLMFGQKIHSFTATNGNGGEIWHSGKRFGGIFISLSPYCFPIFTYAFLLLSIIGASNYSMWFDILIGFTLAFHVVCFAKQTRSYQPDIQKYGHFKSYLFIVVFWFFNATIILLSIRKGITDSVVYLFPQYWDNIVTAWAYMYNIIAPIISTIFTQLINTKI